MKDHITRYAETLRNIEASATPAGFSLNRKTARDAAKQFEDYSDVSASKASKASEPVPDFRASSPEDALPDAMWCYL